MRWIDCGWRLVGKTAHKTLIPKEADMRKREAMEKIRRRREEEAMLQRQKWEMQREMSWDGYSEGGRLKAHMEVEEPDGG